MLNFKIDTALNNSPSNTRYCECFIGFLSIIRKCIVDEPLLPKLLSVTAERNLLVAVTCLVRRLLGILQNVF